MKKNNENTLFILIVRISIVLVLIAACIMMDSCKSKQLAVSSQQSTIIKDNLTPVAVPGDSASLKALFRCDSLNNVLLIGYSELKSKNMQSAFDFKDNTLSYKATTKPDTVFIKSTDHSYYYNITKTLTITKKVPVIKEVPVHDFIWWIGLIVFVGGIGFGLYKLFTKTKLGSLIKTILKIK